MECKTAPTLVGAVLFVILQIKKLFTRNSGVFNNMKQDIRSDIRAAMNRNCNARVIRCAIIYRMASFSLRKIKTPPQTCEITILSQHIYVAFCNLPLF
jgi:hypothetical protein